MGRTFYLRRIEAYKASLKKIDEIIKPLIVEKENTSNAKKVLCYLNDKLIGEYDSISKCATALGMSRLMVRKAIENGTVLENGFKLTFN